MAACGNTMKSQNVTVTELLPGFVVADKGGVVRIAELQSQGYLYLRQVLSFVMLGLDPGIHVFAATL